ncbi:MAG TPA: hypothetical protein VNZ06_13275 [Steroidobacteraceae bacterium]|jgi:hypothetical protein|nr:hypothetical protein [Steroidobacteraceae bacterium]
MSLSAVSDLGWRLQRDLLGVSGPADPSLPAALAAGRVAAAATESSDTADAGDATRHTEGGAAQHVQLFMQALFQALSSAATAPSQSPGSAGNSAAVFSAPSGLTYSRGSVARYRSHAYQQGSKGLQGKIQSLISALSDPQEAPDSNVSGLQGAFNRLLQDLEAGGTSIASSSFGGGATLTLRSWLLGLQHNLQQPGTTAFSAVGNMVDVVV